MGQVAAGHHAGWKFLAYFAVVFYCFPIYLYFNFAGYCDIVIAANRFFGMKLPENFNRPWLSRNVLDFWTRWHITLGTWIRDYLFMPMYKPVVDAGQSGRPAWPGFSFSRPFSSRGAWHGSTVNFLLFGALQGLGASAAKLWENRIIAARGRAGLKKYMKSARIRAAAIVLTFHYQCFTLLFFAHCRTAVTRGNCFAGWQKQSRDTGIKMKVHHVGYLTKNIERKADELCRLLAAKRLGEPVIDVGQGVAARCFWT